MNLKKRLPMGLVILGGIVPLTVYLLKGNNESPKPQRIFTAEQARRTHEADDAKVMQSFVDDLISEKVKKGIEPDDALKQAREEWNKLGR